MNLPVEYMNLSLRLCRAAENNDVWELYIIEAKNPDLLHCSLVWGENPLHIACKHGSLQFVEKILKLSPGLATKRNDHGFSPMHVAAANGHHAIVQVLAELDPRLCLLGDIDCKIPLHVAAMEGKEDVVRALVIACPESLRRVTSQGETALHLALKFGQSGAFKVLIEELRKFNLEGELLNRKDYQGNTVLHIATSHKLIEIVKLLLVGDSTNGTLLVDVNAINERGYTALDVHNNTSNDTLARRIRHILCDVGALEGRFLSNYKEKPPPSHRQKRRYKIVSLEVRNVLIMVFVMTVTLTFTASCSPQIVYQPQNPEENQLFVDWHLVLGGSNQFRAFFYYMMFNIAGFIASMGAILVLIWPLPFRAVLTFVLVTTMAIYVILVEKTMPKFNIMLGSSHISSTMFVWLAALAFILCGATIWVLAKLCVRLFAKFF